MHEILLVGLTLLLCSTLAQGLVCNKFGGENYTCVLNDENSFCFTSAVYTAEGNLFNYGCAYFSPCLTWEPFTDRNNTYVMRCCNTDRCNGYQALADMSERFGSP